tara:strand:+ start:2397 stop:2699 length:303 start_codon:yes stop_codon:yes gene_type:complete
MKDINNEIIFPCDIHSLILIHFIRVIAMGKERHNSPADYFSELGIVVPKELNDWKFFDDASKLLDVQGLIISSKVNINNFDDLLSNFGYDEDNTSKSKKH